MGWCAAWTKSVVPWGPGVYFCHVLTAYYNSLCSSSGAWTVVWPLLRPVSNCFLVLLNRRHYDSYCMLLIKAVVTYGYLWILMDTCGLCPERDQMPCVQRIPCRASHYSFFETFVLFSVSWLQRLLQRPLPPCLGKSCCDRNMPRSIGIHTGIHVTILILVNVYSCYVPRFPVGMEQHARRSLKHNYQPKCLINIFASCQLVVKTKVANPETAAAGIRKVAPTTILTENHCWLRPTC